MGVLWKLRIFNQKVEWLHASSVVTYSAHAPDFDLLPDSLKANFDWDDEISS